MESPGAGRASTTKAGVHHRQGMSPRFPTSPLPPMHSAPYAPVPARHAVGAAPISRANVSEKLPGFE